MGNAWTAEIQDKTWLPRANWLARHAACVDEAAKGGTDVLLLGDSITDGWHGMKDLWERELAPLRAANFGIGGDETQHVLWRLEHGTLNGITPRVVALLIGTNNLGNSGHSAADTIRGITAVVADLRRRLPTARVLLQAVFPRDARPGTPFRAAIAEVNRAIAGLADNQHVFWLDLGNDFLEADGTIAKQIMPDALHLSAEGYARWARRLTPKLRELLR